MVVQAGLGGKTQRLLRLNSETCLRTLTDHGLTGFDISIDPIRFLLHNIPLP